MAEAIAANREYKDRLFKFIFQKPEELLSLYNAVNGTDYDNPDDIEINTLENVIYMGMRNDVSFLITDYLNLYEHQSTLNPNMPLRGFFYFADLFRKMLGSKADVFGSTLIRIPTPRYLVLYNGTKEEPDRTELLLSDSFKEKELAAIECRAIMLNINAGHNKELMRKCKRLSDYAAFVDMVRQNVRMGLSLRDAIDNAADDCIDQDILRDILTEFREEVHSMLLYEYDEELHIKNEKEISYEEGRNDGINLGMQQGIKQGVQQGMQQGMQQGITQGRLEQIFDLVKQGIITVAQGVQCSGLDADDFAKRFSKYSMEKK